MILCVRTCAEWEADLLSKDDEQEIARRIKEGETLLLHSIFVSICSINILECLIQDDEEKGSVSTFWKRTTTQVERRKNV